MELEQLYRVARDHPWYRDRFFADGSLPILTKAELYQQLQGREADPLFCHDTYWSPSGGSGTTTPLFFPTAVEENLAQRRILAGWLRSQGILHSTTVALNLFSSRCMYRASEIFTDYVELCGGTALPATYQARDEHITELYRRFRPNTLMGSPGRLVQWAHSLEEPVGFEAVLYASEALSVGARQVLDAKLGQPAWSSVMGAAESGVWGFSRFEDELDHFWAPRELVELEIVDPNLQGFGRVIVSNRLRQRHPLLRYDSGDRGRLVPGFCPEVVGLQLAGRHGRSFQFSSQNYDLQELTEVVEGAAAFQVVLRFDQCDWLTLRLVADQETADRALLRLQQVVRANSRINRVEVECCEPHELQSTEHSGKIPPIVDLRS